MAIGSVTVPIDKELPLEDIDGIISTTRCKAVIVGKSSESKIRELLANGGLKSVEMLAAVNNRETVSNTLKMLHVTGFTGEWYLTSTADGTSSETKMLYNYCIIMPEGRVNSKLKTELHKVRPFMIIR